MSASYIHKYIARFIIEAETPLSIGTGNDNIMADSAIARDGAGRPYIPGTALGGVMRQLYLKSRGKTEEESPVRFGDDNCRSRLVISEASLWGTPDVAPAYRQHVKIGEKGTASRTGVFSNEIVVKGSRFCFELELTGDDKGDMAFMTELCDLLYVRGIRVGSKIRSGLGLLKVVEYKCIHLDLAEGRDLDAWIGKASDFNDEIWRNGSLDVISSGEGLYKGAGAENTVGLTPECFFLFSSGFSDRDDEHVDFVSHKENVIDWGEEEPVVKKQWVIPASSVKGALAHRTAFHYNRIMMGCDPGYEPKSADKNEAVKTLFGTTDGQARAGRVMLADIFIPEGAVDVKKLNHVLVDRFTGGAKKDGALFGEKVLSMKKSCDLIYTIDKEGVDEQILEAFETALKDLCNGDLPLGGGVNRGLGIFKGSRK